MSRLRLPGSLVLLVVLLLMPACSSGSGQDDDPRGAGDEPSPSAPETASPSPGPPEPADPRPYRRLDTDQPGGAPSPPAAPAEPEPAQVATYASTTASRADGERLAVLLNHAIEDQTEGSARGTVLDELAADTRDEARRTIESIPAFPDARMTTPSRSWIRSTVRGSTVTVRLVEQVEVPGLGTPEEPYRFWCDNTVVVTHTDQGWRLADFQRAVASETVEFGPRVWREVMDSGRGWRRFDVSG